MTSYKRIIYEYKKVNEIIYNIAPIHNFSYKIKLIDNDNISYILSCVNFLYKKVNYKIDIYYNKYYPFKGP